mgnify:CR=1 FL=1
MAFLKYRKSYDGGEQRYHSVWNGLKETKAGYVYIHDGARPFVNEILFAGDMNVWCGNMPARQGCL